ncbi:MAG TPA: hypothetical protein VHC46_01520, partial [Thermodesulfobacteriota bacterium]|nr:hypothetical protein [Thermodesulfobacteriota bacterium]
NWDPYHFKTDSEPPEIIEEVSRKFGSKLLTRENYKSTYEEDLDIYRKLLQNVRTKGEMCRFLIGRGEYDVSLMIFAESHAANHQFWKYHPDNRERGAEDCELTHAIREVYKAVDSEVGKILERFENPNICIVSSVGMEDDYPNAGLAESFLRRFGYQVSPPPGKVSFSPLDIARRLLPEELRIALSKRMTREKREQLVSDLFRKGTDWTRTRAFAIPVSYTSFIRINLRGREPQGIVGDDEYTALTDEIVNGLLKLTDAETGEPAILSVNKSKELFGPRPHVNLPDIFVEWKPGRFMRSVRHPEGEIGQKKPEFFRRSDHSSFGFIALSGPSVKTKGRSKDIDVLDIAPTFMSLLEEPVPEIMSGSGLDI